MYARQQLTFKTTRKKFPVCRLAALLFGILCCAIFAMLALTHMQWKRTVHKRLYVDQFIPNDEWEQDSSKLIYLDITESKLADKQQFFQQRNKLPLAKIKRPKNETGQQNATGLKSRYKALEHDPTIDENAVPQSFKFLNDVENHNTARELNCSPIQNVVFLRTHRTGSHTISNIFYRYGDYNNVFFALPNLHAFQNYWPLRFHHSHVRKDLMLESSPHFVINVARNNMHNLKSFTPDDAFTVAVARHPVTHFQSIYEYMDFSFFMKFISNKTDLFSEFLQAPEDNIKRVLNATQLFDPVFHLLKNPQLFDLGYETIDYNKTKDLDFIIEELEKQIDFVIIAEYLEESLVVLQRMLCWQLSDMVYVNQRVRRQRDQITKIDKENILRWNKEDARLYNHFNETLWKIIADQDASFWQDVKELKKQSFKIKNECTQNETSRIPSHSDAKQIKSTKKVTSSNKVLKNANASKINANQLNASQLNTSQLLNNTKNSSQQGDANLNNDFEHSNILRTSVRPEIEHLCQKLLLVEKKYINYLKQKQSQMIHDTRQLNFTKIYFPNSTTSHFLYLKTVLTNDSSSTANATDESFEETEKGEEIQEILLGA